MDRTLPCKHGDQCPGHWDLYKKLGICGGPTMIPVLGGRKQSPRASFTVSEELRVSTGHGEESKMLIENSGLHKHV